MLCCWNYVFHSLICEDTAHNTDSKAGLPQVVVLYAWQINFTFFACSGALVTPAHLLELAVSLLKVFG